MDPSCRLSREDVHVWHARVSLPPDSMHECHRLLSSDERARACRFHFDRDRDRYVAARGTLRRLLARYTGQRPEDLVLDVSNTGKPTLQGGDGLHFNVAHSSELALFAFARHRSIGIDVEWMRPLDNLLAVARSFCSAVEYDTLCQLPPPLRTASFYACWTRKEAYVKARGGGLSIDLRSFSVSMSPGHEGPVALDTASLEESGSWRVENVHTAAGYAAAFAVADGFTEVLHFDVDRE